MIFGTYRRGPEVGNLVAAAVAAGITRVDTAMLYGNEEAVAAAAQGARVTTKIPWYCMKSRAQFAAAVDARRADTILLHAPAHEYLACWDYLVNDVNGERCAHVGVSNFSIAQMEQLDVLPEVNQFEHSLNCRREHVVRWCLEHGVEPQAHTVLRRTNVPVGAALHYVESTGAVPVVGASTVQQLHELLSAPRVEWDEPVVPITCFPRYSL